MIKYDKEEKLGHSLIHHGKANDRIYVMNYKYALDPYLINQVQLMAKSYQYGKVIIKIPKAARFKFSRNSFDIEAKIPGYFKGKKPCFFMAKYFKEEREKVDNKKEILDLVKAYKTCSNSDLEDLDPSYKIEELTHSDVDDMVKVYREVFETYPFPIHDENYIRKTMDEDFVYFGVFDNDQLVGISSCDVNLVESNVEMTDFAVLPSERGNHLARHLLDHMETAMKRMGVKTAYTIARSVSYPMNAVFAKADYEYGGTLWNNTQIAGEIESMNIWYKPLYK